MFCQGQMGMMTVPWGFLKASKCALERAELSVLLGIHANNRDCQRILSLGKGSSLLLHLNSYVLG